MKGMSYVGFAVLCLLAMVLLPVSASAAGESAPNIYLSSQLSTKKAVVGEMIAYDVVLHSSSPDIAGVMPVTEPSFDGLVSYPLAPDNRISEPADGDGGEYTAVVARYFLSPAREGKYKVKAPSFVVGVALGGIGVDPFWGDIIPADVKEYQLTAPDLSLRVSALPQKKVPDGFSGAVGEFEIAVELPKGHIVNDEDAVVLFTICGRGNLEKAQLPEIHSLFDSKLRFKSETPVYNHFIKDGELWSEIEIECVFCPSSTGRFRIQPATFCFFNNADSRYECVTSAPLDVDVGDASREAEPSAPQFEEI